MREQIVGLDYRDVNNTTKFICKWDNKLLNIVNNFLSNASLNSNLTEINKLISLGEIDNAVLCLRDTIWNSLSCMKTGDLGRRGCKWNNWWDDECREFKLKLRMPLKFTNLVQLLFHSVFINPPTEIITTF